MILSGAYLSYQHVMMSLTSGTFLIQSNLMQV